MPGTTRAALGWAILAFCAAILLVGVVIVVTLPRGQSAAAAGSANGTVTWAVALAAAAVTFFLVKSSGAPRVAWGRFLVGVVVAVVAIGISTGSYSGATQRGGAYLIAWGPALWGIYRAATSFGRA